MYEPERKIYNNFYSGKIMIRNYSLDKNFRRLKVLNKHLAKYLHFFSFTYELYTGFTTARSIITSHRLHSTPFKYLLFKPLCVFFLTRKCPLQSHAEAAEPEEMVEWNVKSILCGLLLITLYWDRHYISHIRRCTSIRRGSKTWNFIIPSK